MSGAGAALRAAAIEALEALGGVYPGPPLQAAFPYLLVEAGAESDWGHKSGQGREVRLAVTVRDAGEEPDRAQALALAAETALGAPLEVEGWRVVTFVLLRLRAVATGRGNQAGWAATLDYRARMLAEEA